MERYNWTLNENDKIVFPVPETVKTPWKEYRGDLPFTLEYFNGTMYEKVEEILILSLNFLKSRHMLLKYC